MQGLRKRDIFPALHWASELSTELLACVKRYVDDIEIDTAMPREKRERLSILRHHTPTLYAHAHTYTTHWKVHSPNSLPETEKKNPKQSFFFIFKEEQI